jgi:tripartite-type tricarboxylate transporter receptor subunit TctC
MRGCKRLSIISASFLLAFSCWTTPACAEWPERSVSIIVPYAAGGNTDVMARITAQELQRTLGQSFVVENVVGAGGAIATQNAARVEPDGYKLLFATSAQFSILPNMQKVNYDPIRDFIPLAVVGQAFSVLGIHPSVPARTLPEFVAHVKANPGKLNYGTGGAGTVGHLVMASFAARAGIDMVHVPYKGGSQAMNDLLSGQVQAYFGNSSELVSFYKGDKLRILAVGTLQRAGQFADVPTVAEFYPGFALPAWNGMLAPAGTPPAVVTRLTQQIQAIVKDPKIVTRLNELGIEAGGAVGPAMAAMIVEEQKNYKAAISAAGLETK